MGVAIVIVNHVRTVATQLHEILPRFTAMPVELITDRLVIQPNRVFIIPGAAGPARHGRGVPPQADIKAQRMARRHHGLPAFPDQHWDGKLIAVIVSGYDGDGAAALCGIREVGGITIAQRPDTAKQPDMPESAIASGCIDFVLSPEEIATEVIRISNAALDQGVLTPPLVPPVEQVTCPLERLPWLTVGPRAAESGIGDSLRSPR